MKTRRTWRRDTCLLGAAAAFVAYTLIALVVNAPDQTTSHLPGHSNGPATPRLPQTFLGQRYALSFSTCNGFTNQRLSIAYGAVLANATGRVMLLPHLIRDGTQHTLEIVGSSYAENTLPFSHVYDQRHFMDSLRIFGMHLAASNTTMQAALKVTPQQALDGLGSGAELLDVGCPLFGIASVDMAQFEPLFWATLAALSKPSPEIQNLVQQFHNMHPAYNFLHLRAETDWLQHCHTWQAQAPINNNCYNNTVNVASVLQQFSVDTSLPLDIACDWRQASPDSTAALAALEAAGYSVITRKALSSSNGDVNSRDVAAAADYFIALGAEKFIGNSVSTFSALASMERRQKGLWSAHYNMGDIPLETHFLPFFKLPWVFTYNSWSQEYDYMMFAAVESGLQAGLNAFCLFSGDLESPAAKFLLSKRVPVIQRSIMWKEALLKAARSKLKENAEKSHLYSEEHTGMLVGTFQRIDIPLLPELMQYTYVLFTDCDVYFRRPFTLADFPRPLPETVGMAIEIPDAFPFNAGVMLMKLPALRRSYHTFLAFILNDQNGLYFEGYGPVDQGAYNKFYEDTVRRAKLPEHWNAKPYKTFDPKAYIVHFHGSKPADYNTYVATGHMRFDRSMYDAAFQRGLCQYIHEWVAYLPSDAHNCSAALMRACKVPTA